MAVMQCNGYQLEYEEYGSGDRVLLCCQQNHSRIQNWTISLAETGLFHVYDITIRGYGRSTHVTEDLGEEWYDVWANDACGFADALGVDRFFYTGMSHGAGIGWHLCVQHPERVRGFFAIVGGPHSKDGADTGEARMRTIRAAENAETWKAYCDGIDERSRPVRTDGMTDEEWEKALALHEEDMSFWYGMTLEEARLNPRKPFPKLHTEAELIEVLSKIEVPTLMMGGMKDPISLPENMIRSLKAVKNSKLVLYEDATHSLDREHKEEIVEDICSFARIRGLL